MRLRHLLWVFCLASGLLAAPACAQGSYGCLRFRLSPQVVVYAEFEGYLLRLAASPQALASARPHIGRGGGRNWVYFSSVPLPAAPPWTGIKMQLNVDPQGKVHIFPQLSCKDQHRAVWTYALDGPVETLRPLDQAPLVTVPDLSHVTLKLGTAVETKQDVTKLGVGLHLRLGDWEVRGIGGRSWAQMRIFGDNGSQVVSEQGPYAKFGFG